MCDLEQLLKLVCEYAPLEISHKAIEQGDYDNSGIIVKSKKEVKKVLFSLDLSIESVKKGIELGVDTIITHHPAIYNPIKTLDVEGQNAELLLAIKSNMNVISMHLNLDMAKLGIDHYLAIGLGADDYEILSYIDDGVGYGREFGLECDVKALLERAIAVFGSEKIVLYGEGKVKRVASFCGSGGSHAEEAIKSGKTSADLIVTSDLPHHLLKEIIERGKKVMIIPHYVSEQFGFKKFYEFVKGDIEPDITAYYFLDKRFM